MLEAILVIVLSLGGVFYLIYRSGYIIITNTRSMKFAGNNQFIPQRYIAEFKKCVGYIRKGLYFNEYRRYCFKMDCSLFAGEFKITLKDADKNVIFTLDKNNNTGYVDAVPEKKYYIIFEFKKATGNIDISWE